MLAADEPCGYIERDSRPGYHVFTETLEERGYAVVEEPGHNFMLLRPAIIDLDVTSPDLPSADRNRNYVASAGSARWAKMLVDALDDVHDN